MNSVLLFAVSLCSVGIVLVDSLSCANEKATYPGISDIFLTEDDEDILAVEIDSGSGIAFKYCRELDLKSEELEFMDISCDDIKDYDWETLSTTDTSAILSVEYRLNTTISSDYILYLDFLELDNVTEFGIDDAIMSESDYYIHPSYYSWFYSAQLDVLCIFTIDVSSYNESSTNLTLNETFYDAVIDSTDLNIIFIAFNQANYYTRSDYAISSKKWSEVYDSADNLVKNDVGSIWDIVLDDDQITNFDELYIFPLPVDECEQGWFSYQVIDDLYSTIVNANVTGSWDFEIIYIGDEYSLIDDRVPRAYGFSSSDIWWYETDSNNDGTYVSLAFAESDFLNWWVLIWVVVGGLCYCCLFCLCACKIMKWRKNKAGKFDHFNADKSVSPKKNASYVV